MSDNAKFGRKWSKNTLWNQAQPGPLGYCAKTISLCLPCFTLSFKYHQVLRALTASYLTRQILHDMSSAPSTFPQNSEKFISLWMGLLPLLWDATCPEPLTTSSTRNASGMPRECLPTWATWLNGLEELYPVVRNAEWPTSAPKRHGRYLRQPSQGDALTRSCEIARITSRSVIRWK